MKKNIQIMLLLIISNFSFAQKLALDEFPASDHLTINGNIINVKNWGEKFDGDYDVLQLAKDSCVSGNCEKGHGRRVVATIKNGMPRIRIMEGKFINKTFLGEGPMLIDGYGKILDGTYEFGKFKLIYGHNSLESKGVFHSKFTNEDVIGSYLGYSDFGIGSETVEYKKFVICDFSPLYSGKDFKETTWKKDIYEPAYSKWLDVFTHSPKFLAERAAIQAKYNSGPSSTSTKATTTNANNSSSNGVLTYCPICNGTGKVVDKVTSNTQFETTHYKTCSHCGGSGR